MIHVIGDTQIALNHISLILNGQLTADDNSTLRIRKCVAHLAIGMVTAENDIVTITSEPNRDDVGITIGANSRKPCDARLL